MSGPRNPTPRTLQEIMDDREGDNAKTDNTRSLHDILNDTEEDNEESVKAPLKPLRAPPKPLSVFTDKNNQANSFPESAPIKKLGGAPIASTKKLGSS